MTASERTDAEARIVACVREHPGISEARIAVRTGLPPEWVGWIVSDLRKSGRAVKCDPPPRVELFPRKRRA